MDNLKYAIESIIALRDLNERYSPRWDENIIYEANRRLKRLQENGCQIGVSTSFKNDVFFGLDERNTQMDKTRLLIK